MELLSLDRGRIMLHVGFILLDTEDNPITASPFKV
jgi:hypothetical protein